jgi:hypothetical protein
MYLDQLQIPKKKKKKKKGNIFANATCVIPALWQAKLRQESSIDPFTTFIGH